MSVAYEPRNFLHEGNYPSIDDDHTADARYGDDVAEQLSHYTTEAGMSLEDGDVMGDGKGLMSDNGVVDDDRLDFSGPTFPSPLHLPVSAPQMPDVETLPSSKEVSPSAESPNSRGKTMSKPEREAVKGADGRFHCIIPDCREEVRSFARKCEWNKHMDKHERPYRCLVEGCENLPGFTYSGGLLRHEREVHGKHGGPKKTVNCPHPTCKRHTGKGFSRQENLNEHLRRVHTNPDGETPPAEGAPSPEDNDSERSSAKRKRLSTGDGQIQYGHADPTDEVTKLRDEIKLVRDENQKLKADMEQQGVHAMAMMQQIAELQEALRQGISHSIAPTAQMI